MANHALEIENDNAEGTYTFIYRPKIHVRQKLFEISESGVSLEQKKQLLADLLRTVIIGKEDYEVAAFTRTSADFTDNEIYKQLVGDFENATFPNPHDEDAALIGVTRPAYFSLIREVTCTFVKALRNVVNDMKYSKTNPLYKLLSYKSAEITGADAITEKVKELNVDISGLSQIKDLSQSIKKTLSDAVGSTYSPSINISSDLPEDIVDLVQSLALVVEDSLGYQGSGNIEDLSLGGANLIYLALKLYEYEVHREREDKIAHFLLIEEPEAHIHNHIQKTLFSNFHSLNTQVFISTHSTQISSVAQVSALNVISRKPSHSEVYWPANNLDPSITSNIERYLDAMRSTLLFAKGVILVEGDAEQILIPPLIKSVLGISLDEMGISIVKMDGTVFKHISTLFHSDRIRNYCAIVTDLDAPFLTETTDYADDAYLEKLDNARISGEQRMEKLNEHCDGNSFLNAFYAHNTFETELIIGGNDNLFTAILSSVYSQQARIDELTGHLTANNEKKCFYALRLANKVGKGWLAVMMSNNLSPQSSIPDYIMKALAHALNGHLRENIYRKMMAHRLNQYEIPYEGFMGLFGNKWDDCATTFKGTYPNDPLTILMNLE